MNCDKCRRPVRGTVHTKDDYKVDMFRLWTGKTVPVTFKEEGEEEIKFLKIEQPSIITLCDKCIASPDVEDALKNFESPL